MYLIVLALTVRTMDLMLNRLWLAILVYAQHWLYMYVPFWTSISNVFLFSHANSGTSGNSLSASSSLSTLSVYRYVHVFLGPFICFN